MRTLLFLIFALPLFASFCEAQIVVIHFTDQKVAKRYKKHARPLGDELVLIGEPVPKGGIQVKNGGITYRGASASMGSNNQNELFVLDSKNPEAVPYKVEDGQKTVKSRKSVVALPGEDIGRIEMFMRGEDLRSLASEYRYRRHRIEAHEVARKAEDKGSAKWFTYHRLVVLEYQRLHSWLEQNTFFVAAQKLQKQIGKELKVAKEDALASRAKKAMESIHSVDTYPDLIKASKEITGGKMEYSVKESQHVRLVYFQDISHVRAKACLELAETIIEGFRVECVDPYLSETFPDQIPDGLFMELMWTPEDSGQFIRFLQEYYHLQLSERQLKDPMGGTRFSRPRHPREIFVYRLREGFSPEGAMAHSVGHALADYHYNGGPMSMNMPWLGEGLAYYVSFEYTGRNSVVCKSFEEGNYVRPEGEQVERTWYGLRDIYHRTALESGRRVDRMALLKLFELEDGDIAKAWSLIDWVFKELKGDGQRWLREGTSAARSRKSFIATWRAASQEVFGVEPSKNVFVVLEERWREFAERFRDEATSAGHRKKR